MTALQIGSMVVVRGNFDENRNDVQLQADVKWCAELHGGVYPGRDWSSRRCRAAGPQPTASGPPPVEPLPFLGRS